MNTSRVGGREQPSNNSQNGAGGIEGYLRPAGTRRYSVNHPGQLPSSGGLNAYTMLRRLPPITVIWSVPTSSILGEPSGTDFSDAGTRRVILVGGALIHRATPKLPRLQGLRCDVFSYCKNVNGPIVEEAPSERVLELKISGI